MSKGPGLFTDIGKKAKDLLTKDYLSDHKFSVSTYSESGVIVEGLPNNDFSHSFLNPDYLDGRLSWSTLQAPWITGEIMRLESLQLSLIAAHISQHVSYLLSNLLCAIFTVIDCDPHALTTSTVKKGGYSSGDVAAQYIYNNTSVDLKVDTESNVRVQFFYHIIDACSIVTSLSPLFLFADLSNSDCCQYYSLIKDHRQPEISNYESGKLEFQYFHPHASLTAAVGLNQAPPIDLSVTLGITVTKPDSCASVILGDKGDTIKASYIHYMDQLKRSAAVGEITRKFSTNENTFTVGGSYAIDGLTLVKVKLNNHGTLGAVLQHEVIRKSLVTISSEFDTKALDKTPRFGVSSP
ncbi:hypothetical protein DH2020_040938 [Rehmannia glutinosa]|uniref:Uncharacterized protein n=1 Tax=Rehmannia glutinosa TaxID=99300 RepID=A0ABR0UT31_REHGL